jgi:hypothetical protein
VSGLRRSAIASAAALVVLAEVGLVRPAAAQDRPSETEMFGGPPAGAAGAAGAGGAGAAPSPAPAAAMPAAPEVAPGPPSRDDTILGDPNAGPRLSESTAPEDPLKIGGQIYLRTATLVTEDQVIGDARFSSPSLVDGYFDARPNDRVRGFVLGRMFFDPTLPTTATSGEPNTSGSGTGGMGTTGTREGLLLSGVPSTRGPSVILDQLWLRFDVKRTVFVTAGRQHVKWGTGRFWAPTDYLHQQRRNPVAVFDARPGFNMLKVHLPWEERGWNFYAFALVEGTRQLDKATGRYPEGSDGTTTLGQIGGAARAELVLGTAELGLDAVVYRDQKPRFGADLSFGVGDFDLYADVGLRYGSDLPRRRHTPDGTDPVGVSDNAWVDRNYQLYYSTGIKPQVVTGGTYSLKYNDNDIFTLAGEYFYNSRGYDNTSAYLGLAATGTFEFFYTGRHYAGLAAILAAPGSWNYTTFTLTTLGNLSDRSFFTRLDYSLLLLTHLRFEAFAAVNYGQRDGEFRVNPLGAPQLLSFGLGLRVSI